jgi:hypothetical protein
VTWHFETNTATVKRGPHDFSWLWKTADDRSRERRHIHLLGSVSEKSKTTTSGVNASNYTPSGPNNSWFSFLGTALGGIASSTLASKFLFGNQGAPAAAT